MSDIAPRPEDFQTPHPNETREAFLLRFLFADAAHDVQGDSVDGFPIKPADREAFIASMYHSKETSLVVTSALLDDLPQELKAGLEEKARKVAQARQLGIDVQSDSGDGLPIKPADREAFIASMYHSKETSLGRVLVI